MANAAVAVAAVVTVISTVITAVGVIAVVLVGAAVITVLVGTVVGLIAVGGLIILGVGLKLIGLTAIAIKVFGIAGVGISAVVGLLGLLGLTGLLGLLGLIGIDDDATLPQFPEPIGFIIGGSQARTGPPALTGLPNFDSAIDQLTEEGRLLINQIPVNLLSIPVQGLDFISDDCGDGSVRFRDGICYPVLRKGPCESPTQWLTVDPLSLQVKTC